MNLRFICTAIIFFSISFAQSFSSTDEWDGKYIGTCSVKYERNMYHGGSPEKLEFIIYKNKNEFKASDGVGGYKYHFTIHLPINYNSINRLDISDSRLKFEASRRYPFSFDLRKTKDSYGDQVLTGTVKTFKVLSDGSLSLRQKFSNINVYQK